MVWRWHLDNFLMIFVTWNHHFPCSIGTLIDGLVSRKRFWCNGRLLLVARIKVRLYIIESCLHGLKMTDRCLFDDICDIESLFPVFVRYFDKFLVSSKKFICNWRLPISITVLIDVADSCLNGFSDLSMISVTSSPHFPFSSGSLNDCSVSSKQFIRDGTLRTSIKVLIYVIESCLNGLKGTNGCLFDDICDIESFFAFVFVLLISLSSKTFTTQCILCLSPLVACQYMWYF